MVAASAEAWASGKPYSPLFDPSPGVCLRWRTKDTITWWPAAWARLLATSTPRPIKLPAEFEIESVVRASVAAYPGHELRTIAIRPVPDPGHVNFEDGWPEG